MLYLFFSEREISEGRIIVDAKKVFVIHGRNEKIRAAMFQFLRAIGLEPLEWNQAKMLTDVASPYIGDILNAAFNNAGAIIALFTPDDEAKLKDEFINPGGDEIEKTFKGQARPNVIFEAGMAYAFKQDKTILIEVGDIKPFSDISGRHIFKWDNSARKRSELIDILGNIGMAVETEGKGDYWDINFPIPQEKIIQSHTSPQPEPIRYPVPISLSSYILFHDPSSAVSSLGVDVSVSNYVKLSTDCWSHKPEFAGYAVNLGNSDWTEYCRDDCYLQFSAKYLAFSTIVGSKTAKIIIEVKGKDKSAFYNTLIDVGSEYSDIHMRLREMTLYPNEFKEMMKLVFLLKPDVCKLWGTLEIKDLKIVDTLR